MTRGRVWLALVALVWPLTLPASASHPPSRSLATYVLLGLDSIRMKEFAFFNVGNVGVNNADGTLTWGRKSFFHDGSQVVSDVLLRAGDQSSLWDLYANRAVGSLQVTIRNEGPLLWAPTPLVTPLPPTPSCSPGAGDVIVPKNGALTLGPGNYRALRISNGATLELAGGAYCFQDVKGGRGISIEALAPVDVTVTGKFVINVGSTLGPATGSGIGSTDVHLDVAGTIAKFGHHARVSAQLFAPRATVRFGRGAFYTGQFVGRQLRSDFGDSFTLEVCGNGIVDPGEECDGGQTNGQPGSCCTATCDFAAEGTACPDGTLCNGNETCSAFGQCRPGTPLDCDDGNVCTADTCVPATGCVRTPVPDLTPCPDGNLCNGDEVCLAGTCTDRPDPNCNDGDPCTSDGCNPILGCQNPPVPSPIAGCDCPNGDADCDDHDVCDGIETCDPSGTFCHPGTPPSCTTTNPCAIPACNPASGCVTLPVPPGTSCNDGDACTGPDTCTGSACGGLLISCSDGDPCTGDTCDPQTGCANPPIPDCTPGGTTFCSLTQGAYGAGNGVANGPQGWITQNPGALPITIGGFPSVTIATQAGLVAFMPTGGPGNAFCGNLPPGPCPSLTIAGAGDVPDPSGSGSGGYGAGVLAGQTLALALSVELSDLGANPSGLGNLALSTSFCTCDGPTASGPFTIDACVVSYAGTVDNLLTLANQALAGISLTTLDPCLTYSSIVDALDALNNGFDECRTLCPCP